MTVLVIAGLSAAVARGGPDGSPVGAASAPATVDVLDAGALETMRTALAATVPAGLADRADVVPLDADGITPLDLTPGTRVGSAYAVVREGDRREWRLFVAVGSTPGDRGATAESADGTLATQRFVSVRRTDAGPGHYALVDPDDVRVEDLADLRVEQVVRLDLPGGGRVAAWETRYGVAGADVHAVAADDRALTALVRAPALLAALTGTDPDRSPTAE